MAKKPEPPAPIIWDIYRAAAKLRPMGTVEAPDEAIEKATAKYGVPATDLTAVR